MKTNKEIKPFKMRVTESQSIKVRAILLLKYNYKEYGYEETHPFILVNSPLWRCTIQSGTDEHRFENLSAPELTYSEFMKLYGEEEEVFTREDMKDIATKILLATGKEIRAEMTCIVKGSPRINFSGVDEWITKYLSERTND